MADGECYRNAVMWAIKSGPDDAEVVHGTIRLISGKRTGHAWVEYGDTAVDPTIGLKTSKKKYYAVTAAKPVSRYPAARTIGLSHKHGHWGPWESVEESKRHRGYKIVGFDGKRYFSIYDPKTTVDVTIGKTTVQKGGLYLGSSEQFCTDYYAGGTDFQDALLTYEFDAGDVIRGDPEHPLDELLVRKATLKSVKLLPVNESNGKSGIFKSTYSIGGKKVIATAIKLSALHGGDYSGLPEKILAEWRRRTTGKVIPYVGYDDLAKAIGEPVGDVVAQLKAIFDRDRTAIGFTVDRMGNNSAFKINRPEAFVTLTERVVVPPHMPAKFFDDALSQVKEFNRQLRFLPDVCNKLQKVERELTRGRDFDYILADLNGVKRLILPPTNFDSLAARIDQFISYSKMENVRLQDLLKSARVNLLYLNNQTLEQWADRMKGFYERVKDMRDPKYGAFVSIRAELDATSDEYLKSTAGVTRHQAEQLLQRAAALFMVVEKAIVWYKNFYQKVNGWVVGADTRSTNYYKGGEEKPPAHGEVETLYHATPYVREIESGGFKVNTTKALGGETDNAISFTGDPDIAKAIAQAFVEAIHVAQGKKSFEQVRRSMLKRGASPSFLQTTELEYADYVKRREQGRLSDWDRTHGGEQRERYFAFELFRRGMAGQKKQYDPLFFGVDYTNFEKLDPKNVGVFAAQVRMKEVVRYLASMEEYRVPPSAIVKFQRYRG